MSPTPSSTEAQAVETIRAALVEAGVDFAEPQPQSFLVNLPGERRLNTACWLIVGTQGLRIDAFVVRRPDENTEEVYAWLLRLNARSYLVSWSIDEVGDIYLSGRLPLSVVSAEEVDRILGVVLEYSDSEFNTLLRLGFGSSIRREWAWRTRRGESTANLAAFEAFIHQPDQQAGH
jgi:Putative bacterial sensory transduction regulator